MKRLACNLCAYYSIKKEGNNEKHLCACKDVVPWFIDGQKPTRRILSAYFNPEGLCKFHSDRGYKCHWCGAVVAERQCGVYDYRLEANTWNVCPDCLKKHKALLKSLNHWTDNASNLSYYGLSAPQQRDWFLKNCGFKKCACCIIYNDNLLCSEACPLSGDACCDGLWGTAKDAADVGVLNSYHLQKIRDYIYLVCVNEGIVEKPSQQCLYSCRYYVKRLSDVE